ncbi:bifunctional 4-hydroxy-2-oxoglutarate aldolase/2-dehydro-3-deoxy-phosphogluconate aldolase [Streptomyces sp. NBC_00876]|uniref:bifunctional 4-hydroxy-2-oxoglutarate aldolase/2-dehydro-3-deoxy-phosphogluconate aldolase n=1 Tax=Streptomyces sp. NBC_00876 TaxID=2975853 RepID=UPI0038683B6D|nr:bifunctional 4-hydroxy-2-oxoglutarate aldolase/2-dehydro-3-deoxy-phosphogluconate aldolase [Streptomyces sp. NBC_00876]
MSTPAPQETLPATAPHHETLRAALRDHGLVAILRSSLPGAPLVETVRTLADAGVRCIEITLPTPGGLAALAELRGTLPPECLLGVGTVTETAHIEQVTSVGARFVVSPCNFPGLLPACNDAGLGSLPGAFTATEAWAAWQAGASAVKLFPAEPLGPRTVAALHAPLPQLPLVPTGGIGLDDIRPYLDAGALAVGIGSPLLKDALTGGSQKELHARAAEFVARCARA